MLNVFINEKCLAAIQHRVRANEVNVGEHATLQKAYSLLPRSLS